MTFTPCSVLSMNGLDQACRKCETTSELLTPNISLLKWKKGYRQSTPFDSSSSLPSILDVLALLFAELMH